MRISVFVVEVVEYPKKPMCHNGIIVGQLQHEKVLPFTYQGKVKECKRLYLNSIIYYLWWMFLSFITYKRVLVIALTVLVAVPCLAKKEMKQRLNIETSQQSKHIQQGTACNTFCQLQKHDKKEKVEKHIQPSSHFEIEKVDSCSATNILFPDFHNRHKEKIPSYILFERFLI